MVIKWTLRLVTGIVAREKDTATVQTTAYGTTSADAMVSARTVHSKQLWVQSDDGKMVTAQLQGTQNVSASPGDRVRVVFADPGGHVVGLNNETLETTWTWKYPSNSGCLALIAALSFFAMPIAGLVALWRGSLLIGAALLAVTAFIVIVPLGRNRRKVRNLHRQRQEMLSPS